jgi:cytoskeletal protein RodZ
MREFVPTGSPDVVHTARLEEIVTAAQPVMEIPFTMKLTVPVAPAVTVAVSVTVCPNADVTLETASAVLELVPGVTGTRGSDLSLNPAAFVD